MNTEREVESERDRVGGREMEGERRGERERVGREKGREIVEERGEDAERKRAIDR